MSGTYFSRVGNKGRIVIPAGLRESKGWTDETELLFVEDPERGVLLMTREELEVRVRAQLAGPSLVDELIAERRAAAEIEDSE